MSDQQQPTNSASQTNAISSEQVRSTPSTSSLNVDTLGYFLDGWADLIEGMGERAEEVRTKVLEGLKLRKMPQIEIAEITGFVTEFGGERRSYTITQTAPGAATTLYIGKHGIDLYTSWRTFIKPVLNQGLIIALLIVSAILGLITGGIDQVGGGFFGGESRTVFSFSGWIIYTLFFLILAVIVLGLIGRIWKGNFLAFFFIEPNIFDAEDITAMSLSAHKTLIRALDNTGIDVTKLRLKQNFKGGRRDEMV